MSSEPPLTEQLQKNEGQLRPGSPGTEAKLLSLELTLIPAPACSGTGAEIWLRNLAFPHPYF